MYFDDLTPYCYLGRKLQKNVLNVGWLDANHLFPKGPVPDHLLKGILGLCFTRLNETMGFHNSPFVHAPFGYWVEYNGKRMRLGSAEIRVPGSGKKSYAAPNLIYHYIKDCGYLPPKEFLDALESIPVGQ